MVGAGLRTAAASMRRGRRKLLRVAGELVRGLRELVPWVAGARVQVAGGWRML